MTIIEVQTVLRLSRSLTHLFNHCPRSPYTSLLWACAPPSPAEHGLSFMTLYRRNQNITEKQVKQDLTTVVPCPQDEVGQR